MVGTRWARTFELKGWSSCHACVDGDANTGTATSADIAATTDDAATGSFASAESRPAPGLTTEYFHSTCNIWHR